MISNPYYVDLSNDQIAALDESALSAEVQNEEYTWAWYEGTPFFSEDENQWMI